MPRHKTFPDEQVLDDLFELILQTGPDGMTFVLAAEACGLSPATLMQRYGKRPKLVEAVLLRAWDRLQARTEEADAEEPLTPQGAVNLLMRLMPPEEAEVNATDGLLLLREDLRNPKLRARGAMWGEALACVLGRRLSGDPHQAARLGWQMASVWQGAHTWWAFSRDDTPERSIRRMLEEWLVLVAPPCSRARSEP